MTWIYMFLYVSIWVTVSSLENYGPYNLKWYKFAPCKGPKPGDCGKLRLENTQDMSDVIFVIDFPKDCPVTKAKVTIGSKQNNNSTKKLWNYSLDSPCQHFVLGPILVDSFNLTNDCKINKGHYDIHINMIEKTSIFLGSSFFYGNYLFKVIAHNKVNNFFCIDSHVIIEKKTPNK